MKLKMICTALLLLMLCSNVKASGFSTGSWSFTANVPQNQTSDNTEVLQADTNLNVSGSSVTGVVAESFTNAVCSNSGQATGITATQTSVKFTLDGGSVTFDESTGYVVGTGGCVIPKKTTFTAVEYAHPSGTFYNNNNPPVQQCSNENGCTNGGPLQVNYFTVNVNSDFSLSGNITGYLNGKAIVLTINGVDSKVYGPSFQSGDFMDFYADDGKGNVIGFVVSATDSDGDMVQPPWPSNFYMTYVVMQLADAQSQSQVGTVVADLKLTKTIQRPIAPTPHRPMHRLPVTL